MGFFDKFLKADEDTSKTPKKSIDWLEVKKVNDVETILETSKRQTAIVFKHSTRCPVSRMALNRFEAEADFDNSQVAFFFLDLIQYREVSNLIAEKFQVTHQSPQIIILQNQKIIGHFSHHEIQAEVVADLIN
ncbi:bacillithiol system redox-active protein YtxJ [Mesonia sp. HuA40]|uniref:bacillithiol system redox-active protein YtxJ n=1 Tax=Mesonia sp. HuA40 TaxID=2602761 RepID=UPI0011CCDDCF|nr:bacillithiol system redox-active protein YtxJ [Mesonia sp. HuA40]TXK71164.1 bacillithiol system redox-active protein YtxJ [Mesonia sp. HuA40]